MHYVKIMTPLNSGEKNIQDLALSNEAISKFTDGKEIVKIVVVPNKLVNVVIK